MGFRTFALSAALLTARLAHGALQVDLNNTDSIKAAALTLTEGMLVDYTGDQPGGTPGVLPWPKYYWWEAGAMWGSLIDYWYYTGDDRYNDIVTQAMVWQASPTNNFMPPNESKQLGNDDQSFWGLAAMSAAEVKFPNPPSTDPQWLELAQGVFNSQANRWDTDTCGGGLKWQIYWFNNGFTYKNSISNGCFFNLAARLGAYTGNQTYFDWANKTWDWMVNSQMISNVSNVWDGADTTINCSSFDRVQWTYNAGVFMLGAAVMWNQTNGTEQDTWRTRIEGIWSNAQVIFFNNSVMTESACEPYKNCDPDQQSFKAYLSRWMAQSTKVAPWTYDMYQPFLYASAEAAIKTCTGGTNNTQCGSTWWSGGNDGIMGMRQQMTALEVIQGNLIQYVSGPVGNGTGGIAVGNPNAGTEGDNPAGPLVPLVPITTGDRAGAGIVTAIVVVGMLGAFWWMIV